MIRELFLAAGLSLTALLGGCVVDSQYTKQNNQSWKQYYTGSPPKFMRDPSYILPQYKRFK